MKKVIFLFSLLFFLIFASESSLANIDSRIGQLCAIDCRSEFNFFRRYARQGSSLADLSLAIMFLRGQGTEIDIPVGKRYLIRAAKAGEPGAQYQLGYLLMYGIYMPQDIEKSLKWFKRAVNSRVKGAQNKVDAIESMLNKEGIIKTHKHFKKQTVVSPSEFEADSEQYIEVITVTFEASYKHILEAARSQTCNTSSSSCQSKWNSVTAPIIVLSREANN